MGLLEIPDLRHALVDIGTTLLCINGYNGLPGQTLLINLIHETARRSERVNNGALSSADSYKIPGQMMEDGKGPFLRVLKIASEKLRQASKDSGGVL